MDSYNITYHNTMDSTGTKIMGLTVYMNENGDEFFKAKEVGKRLGLTGSSFEWIDTRLVNAPRHYYQVGENMRRRFVPVQVLVAFFRKYNVCPEFLVACSEELSCSLESENVEFRPFPIPERTLRKYREEFAKRIPKRDREKYSTSRKPVVERVIEIDQATQVGEDPGCGQACCGKTQREKEIERLVRVNVLRILADLVKEGLL